MRLLHGGDFPGKWGGGLWACLLACKDASAGIALRFLGDATILVYVAVLILCYEIWIDVRVVHIRCSPET